MNAVAVINSSSHRIKVLHKQVFTKLHSTSRVICSIRCLLLFQTRVQVGHVAIICIVDHHANVLPIECSPPA